MRSLRLWAVAVLVIAAGLVVPGRPEASPESQRLIGEGAQDVAAGRFTEALGKFDAAVAADAADGEAHFFRGVALNRLGRHADAGQALSEATRRGAVNPDLGFETGWALLGTRNWDAAIGALEQYERQHPGRGKTSEFLGRAYLARREFDRAEAKFREAMARDPKLRGAVLLQLARLAIARGDRPGAMRELETALREEPESPLVRRLRDELLTRFPPEPVKPWRVTVSAGGGYNSNAVALSDEQPRLTDISSKRSGFARFTLDAGYDWRLSTNDWLTAGYGFLADVYENVPSFDLRDHLFLLEYRHAFLPSLTGAVRLSDEYTEVGGDAFRNQVGLRTALGYQLTRWALLAIPSASATTSFRPAGFRTATAPPIGSRPPRTRGSRAPGCKRVSATSIPGTMPMAATSTSTAMGCSSVPATRCPGPSPPT